LLNVEGDDVEVSFRFPKDLAHVFSAPRNIEPGGILEAGVGPSRKKYGFCQYIELRFNRMGHTPCRWEVDLSASVSKLFLKRQADQPTEYNEDFRQRCERLLVRAALPLEENHPIVRANGDDVEISFPYPKDMSPRFSAPRIESMVPVNILGSVRSVPVNIVPLNKETAL